MEAESVGGDRARRLSEVAAHRAGVGTVELADAVVEPCEHRRIADTAHVWRDDLAVSMSCVRELLCGTGTPISTTSPESAPHR
jgi:hypothetical protein